MQEPEVESKKFAMAASSSAYQHVANKSNSSLGGVARDKQMVVMSVSKCDPKNFGSGAIGFEKIRVFSRSYNAKKISYESQIILAKPHRVKVTFNGDSTKLMGIDHTKPVSGNGTLGAIFKVFNSVAGSQGSGLIAAVSAIIDKLPLSIGDTVNKSGTNVTFDIGISNLDASSIDLPSATTSSNAKADTKHGIPFEVSYTQRPGCKTANISASAVLTYRLFLNTDRTASIKTGAATISHTVNLN